MGDIGILQFDHTHPYVLLHYEITKNDEKMYEPILERGMNTLV